MPSPFAFRSAVLPPMLALLAGVALTSAPAASSAPAQAAARAVGPSAAAVVASAARTQPGRAAQARALGRQRAAARRLALLARRESRRAHLPQAVRQGPLPAARAPLSGLAALVPALAPFVDAPPPTGPAPEATATPAPAPTATPAPTAIPAVGVLVRDTPSYSATLSRATVPAGQVRLQLQNGGEDPHDLRVERTDDDTAATTFLSTDPGATRTRTVTLAAGSYRLFCTFTAPVVHADAGMRATLVVSG